MTLRIADRGYLMNRNEVGQLLQEAKVKYKCMIFYYYLIRSLDVVYSSLKAWSRVSAMRVDLRFANDRWGGNPDLPTCSQRADHKAITRFFESLKSQLIAEHKRKKRRGEPSLPKYIWVREQDTGPHPHYHLVLFFNKDVYRYLGDYTDPDAKNMATRIQQAWCGAISLPFPDYATRVEFPDNPVYIFDRKSATIHAPEYWKLLLRIAYLCKLRTKPQGDFKHNFGRSQVVRVRTPTDGIIEGL